MQSWRETVQGGQDGLDCRLQYTKAHVTSLWCGSQQHLKKLPAWPHHNAFEGEQLPAWDPGKVKLPGRSAKKGNCRTSSQSLANKIPELHPGSCSLQFTFEDPSLSFLPPSLSCKARDVAIASGGLPSLGPRAGPQGQRENSCSLNWSRKQNYPQHTPTHTPHPHTIPPSFVGNLSLGL